MGFLGLIGLAASFTTYPAFGDRVQSTPPRVEAVTDRGPILELIVRCPAGTAIVSYSKAEKVYCSPKFTCAASAAKVFTAACRGGHAPQ
jgi:hypothetical protein